MTPWETFVRSVEADPAAPRVTFYERTPGPTDGERIELSGKVLLNWASKAANLLVEEFDVEPGSSVHVRLPAAHWRTTYWLLAAWATGARVTLADADTAADTESEPSSDAADVRVGVSGDVDVLVTLAALSRGASVPVPPDALDEARDLPTFADQYIAFASPNEREEAMPGLSFAALATSPPARRAYLAHPTPREVFGGVCGGGIVLVRGTTDVDVLAPLLRQEGLAS